MDDKIYIISIISCVLKTILGFLLIIPAICWVGDFIGLWSVYLSDFEYIVMGASSIAGAYLIANGGWIVFIKLMTYCNKLDGTEEITIKHKN